MPKERRDVTMRADRYLLISDVARQLGVTRQRVHQLSVEGRLPPPAIKTVGGVKVYSESSIREFIRAYRNKNAKEKAKV